MTQLPLQYLENPRSMKRKEKGDKSPAKQLQNRDIFSTAYCLLKLVEEGKPTDRYKGKKILSDFKDCFQQCALNGPFVAFGDASLLFP